MTPRRRRALFTRLRANDPSPTTELEYHSTFELLIAVILSAQATDVSVNLATRRLYRVANTPQAILDRMKILNDEISSELTKLQTMLK